MPTSSFTAKKPLKAKEKKRPLSPALAIQKRSTLLLDPCISRPSLSILSPCISSRRQGRALTSEKKERGNFFQFLDVDAGRQQALSFEPPRGSGAAAESRHALGFRSMGAGPAGEPGGARGEPARGRDGKENWMPFSRFFLVRFRKRPRQLKLLLLLPAQKTRSRSPRASPWERSSRPPPSPCFLKGRRRRKRWAAAVASSPLRFPPRPPF